MKDRTPSSPSRRRPTSTGAELGLTPARRHEAGIGRPGLIGAVLLVGVAGFLAFQTMSLSAHSCEICVDYKGRSICRTVDGPTLEDARMGAIVNACALVSSGMTDSMACQRTPPAKEDCR